MRIVCQQTILMKYHALFVIFEKAAKFINCRLLQIIGGALRIKKVGKVSKLILSMPSVTKKGQSSHFCVRQCRV